MLSASDCWVVLLESDLLARVVFLANLKTRRSVRTGARKAPHTLGSRKQPDTFGLAARAKSMICPAHLSRLSVARIAKTILAGNWHVKHPSTTGTGNVLILAARGNTAAL